MNGAITELVVLKATQDINRLVHVHNTYAWPGGYSRDQGPHVRSLLMRKNLRKKLFMQTTSFALEKCGSPRKLDGLLTHIFVILSVGGT